MAKREKLTEKKVRGYKPKPKAFYVLDTDAKGLRLRVLPSGRKVWYFRGSCNNTDRVVNLGEYHPEHYPLKKARSKAAERIDRRACFPATPRESSDDRLAPHWATG